MLEQQWIFGTGRGNLVCPAAASRCRGVSKMGNRQYALRLPRGGRQTWEDFFRRHGGPDTGNDQVLRDYLKFGKRLGYWLEFVFQAYAGHTGNMILVTGVPDDPGS